MSEDWGLHFAINLLREDGWPIARIAAYLGCDLSTVRRALDEKADAAHKRWSR